LNNYPAQLAGELWLSAGAILCQNCTRVLKCFEYTTQVMHFEQNREKKPCYFAPHDSWQRISI